MVLNYANVIKGKIAPIKDGVIVSDMYFGEQKTSSGLIIKDDDGTTRGIYPRWGRIYAKGPENNEDYNVGDWILIEHGRWTRAFDVDDGSGTKELRMIENKSILGWSKEKPTGVTFGKEYDNGSSVDIRPEDFIR